MDREGLGESVSLAFTGASINFSHHNIQAHNMLRLTPRRTPSLVGTSVSLEFLLDHVGRDAQIAIDGKNVMQLSTFGDGVLVLAGECNPLSWTSSTLSSAHHTLTVTALNPPTNVTIPGWLDFRSFR
jgi:hypothetical protein